MQNKSEKGFTLIEILVVLSILALLVSMTITYSNIGGQQITLFREKARVTQEILRAKSLAITLYRDSDEKICGYGIHFPDAKSLILFKDLPQTDGDCDETPEYDSDTELVEEYALPENIRFFNATETIFFQPPIPTLYFNGVEAGSPEGEDEAHVELRLADSDERTIIRINALGQVNVE